MTTATTSYSWRLGDVFTNGTYRWEVVDIFGDRAKLQSLTTEWARTIYLTYDEWQDHLTDRPKWTLEAPRAE